MLIFIIFGIIVILIFLFSLFVYFSNPFNKYSTVYNPFITALKNGEITITRKKTLIVMQDPISKLFAGLKCAAHILVNTYFGSKKTKSSKVDSIIAEIHRLRFNPAKPYMISGDHFSVLYPRNLGVFYLATVDSRFAIDVKDWVDRQKSYLSATAYALEVFCHAGKLGTTIVPLGLRSATILNIYSYPSDALYGVLYALKALSDDKEIATLFPFKTQSTYKLQTKEAAKTLLNLYGVRLKKIVEGYVEHAFDYGTGLVKQDIHMSGAKDITKRVSPFFDNVILWRTCQLAQELGIIEEPPVNLDFYKKNIIESFWYEEGGYFLEDLSKEGLKNHYFSSDWLAAIFTGFLSFSKKKELSYIERSLSYMRDQKIDKPFGVKYQQTDRAHRQFALVRLFVPDYGGSSIWSFWGSSYIKTLLMAYKTTGNEAYRDIAGAQIQSYEKNMRKYRGFPELYNSKGSMLSNFFYKSIRRTGWVVDFEQAREMYKAYTT